MKRPRSGAMSRKLLTTFWPDSPLARCRFVGRSELPITEADAPPHVHMRVDELVIRADHICRAQAPEGGCGDVPGFPSDGLAISNPGALRSQPTPDDRRVFAEWIRHACVPHVVAAARMVRLTTVSSTGTLYAFFGSGVARATAARAASRARRSLTFLPVRIRSLSTPPHRADWPASRLRGSGKGRRIPQKHVTARKFCHQLCPVSSFSSKAPFIFTRQRGEQFYRACGQSC
jgi:hypothetical protein